MKTEEKEQRTEADAILYVAHMGWGCLVGVIFLIWEVRGESEESEAGNVAWIRMACRIQGYKKEPAVPYHLAVRLGKRTPGPPGDALLHCSLVAGAAPTLEGVVDLGYARVRGK